MTYILAVRTIALMHSTRHPQTTLPGHMISALREPGVSDLAEQGSRKRPYTYASHEHWDGARQMAFQYRVISESDVRVLSEQDREVGSALEAFCAKGAQANLVQSTPL